MAAPNILISGAGIASGVFAFWLLRAYPAAKITIVERDPSLRLTGASVDIRSSAVDIIKQMDAETEIRKQSTNEAGCSFVHSNGNAFATIKTTGRTDIQTITSEYEIFRGALAKIFIGLILDGVDLKFDEFVESYEQHDDGVEVRFAKSKLIKKYDLLVAADGFGSKIRGMMMNTKSSEQIHDEGVYVAYFTIKKDLLQGSRLATWYTAPGGRVILLRPDPDPAGRTRAGLLNVTWPSDTEVRAKFKSTLRKGDEAYKQLMEEQFHDAGYLAKEVLQGMRESDDFYCSLFGQTRCPNLQSNRVVLLGDAGYATPGIGTSLAIIGGYVLAGELLNHPKNIYAALQRYEELMLPFVKQNQGGDQAMQYLNPQSSWGIAIRNVLLGLVTGLKLDRLATTVAAKLGFTEQKFPMPDYQWPV